MDDVQEKIKELSDIERKLLCSLAQNYSDYNELSIASGIPVDSVRRASEWLRKKEYATILEKEVERFFLTPYGEKALSKGMPENILLETLTCLGGKSSFTELEKESGLTKQEFMAALGIVKRKAFVVIMNGVIEETGVAKGQEIFTEQNALRDIADSKLVSNELSLGLQKRGLIEKTKTMERLIKISVEGIKAKDILLTQNVTRTFDVEAPVPRIDMGRRTPYSEFIYSVRRKLVSLGFSEMDYSMVVPEFYNFDVLYQPQNHPARNVSDTYQLKNPQFGSLPDKKIVSAIKAAHENGGKSGSTGWGYDWSEKVASRLMPASHTTAQSAKQLVKGVNIPGKYFTIGRCFRPDFLDATHLTEFNQTEGFVVGEDINFKHLLGMLKEFAIEVAGTEKVKFIPDYFPFTEPSVQLSAKHPDLGWIELGGAGMFRPEMLDNLGIKGEVIAWGLGIDRLAMIKLGLKDIRYLFSDNLDYLRNAKGILA